MGREEDGYQPLAVVFPCSCFVPVPLPAQQRPRQMALRRRKLPDNDRGMLFEFSRSESDFIWLTARSYKETTFAEDANL